VREDVREGLMRSFIGGKGLAAHYLATELPRGVDPLEPDNPLIFMTGPVSGQYAGTCRHVVVTKSPATGGFNDSYAGGYWAWELRKAGLLGVIITGEAERLTYVAIDDGEVGFHDADDLAGMSPAEVDDDPRFADYRVACIGPAGENRVYTAVIANNAGKTKSGRSGFNGRGGAGAVMGAKRLKAIAVRGRGKPRILDAYASFRKEFATHVLDEDKMAAGLVASGTAGYAEFMSMGHLVPTRNWSAGSFGLVDKVGGEAVLTHRAASDGCYNCPVRCGKQVRVDPALAGAYPGAEADRLEYETIALGACNTANADFTSIVHFGALCDRLGIDTISTGSAAAFAMDCAERGLIDHPIRFGDSLGQSALAEDIASRRGLGAHLADGIRIAAASLGVDPAEVPVAQIKGLEMPAYDPRGAVGMALALATADRGACHNRSWSSADDAFLSDTSIDPWSGEGKAAAVVKDQDRSSARWSMVFCEFVSSTDEECTRMLNSVGIDIDVEAYREAGARIWNLIRLLNLREGWTAADDELPPTLYEPQADSGQVITREVFEKMKKEYYELRGWDMKGLPLPNTIESLGLSAYSSGLGPLASTRG
jgi:aldehyde:ferredoxin oxidoreductase